MPETRHEYECKFCGCRVGIESEFACTEAQLMDHCQNCWEDEEYGEEVQYIDRTFHRYIGR